MVISFCFYNADHWFLLCCCVFRSDAASKFMGAWSANTFNAGSCRIKFENAIAISLPSHFAHSYCLVLFLLKFSAFSSSHKLLNHLDSLLFICKWVCNHVDIGLPIGLLCGCQYTCSHQDTVSALSLSVYACLSLSPYLLQKGTRTQTYTCHIVTLLLKKRKDWIANINSLHLWTTSSNLPLLNNLSHQLTKWRNILQVAMGS